MGLLVLVFVFVSVFPEPQMEGRTQVELAKSESVRQTISFFGHPEHWSQSQSYKPTSRLGLLHGAVSFLSPLVSISISVSVFSRFSLALSPRDFSFLPLPDLHPDLTIFSPLN